VFGSLAIVALTREPKAVMVFSAVKQHLRNATPETIKEIRQQVNRGLARLRQRPDMLLNFMRHAGLRVKELW
jgi:hypothetical protein